MPLLDIYAEGRLLQEVKDISEELDIMLSVFKRQSELIKTFCKHVENILDPESRWAAGSGDASPAVLHQDVNSDQKIPDQGKQTQLKWFRIQSQDLLNKVSDRIGELEDLRLSARNTEQSVGRRFPIADSNADQIPQVVDLLLLKQQQASVFQVGTLTNEEEAVSQGRAIMMFTVVTIIFVGFVFTKGQRYRYSHAEANRISRSSPSPSFQVFSE